MADLRPTLAALLGGDKSISCTMRLVRKRGRPFMLLPANATLAAQSLALYPAQTLPARIARYGLRALLMSGLPFGIENISVSISPTNAFVRFLTESMERSNGAAPGAGGSVPSFSVLAGNPNAPGQRFIFLVFGGKAQPATVVKTGITDEAKKLIRRERDFLTSTPALRGIPRVNRIFESPETEAWAMEFIVGKSPRQSDEDELPRLLASWARPAPLIPFREMRVWTELQKQCGTNPIFAELARGLEQRVIHPVLFHGDLAPWNIKIPDNNQWTVFDWERGDLRGMPGYDWLHYFIQTRILVAKKPTRALMQELGQLFSRPEFEEYAALTHISGIKRQLAMIYLLHHNEVIRPGEGLEAGKELLRALMAQYLEC